MIKTMYIQPKKAAYVRPCIKGMAIISAHHILEPTTLGYGNDSGEEEPGEADTKENVWDQVWNREPVFDDNK